MSASHKESMHSTKSEKVDKLLASFIADIVDLVCWTSVKCFNKPALSFGLFV